VRRKKKDKQRRDLPYHRINDEITAREVRVINENGEQIGIMPTKEAIKLAEEQGKDLVEISPNAEPPVAKIMDYSRFVYTLQKKEREARKKQKKQVVKEVKMRIMIGDHDFMVKINNAKKFLEEGKRVKVIVEYRGRREIFYKDRGKELLKRALEVLDGLYQKHECEIVEEARRDYVLLYPVKQE
jgi:translation initiation factor IF-3